MAFDSATKHLSKSIAEAAIGLELKPVEPMTLKISYEDTAFIKGTDFEAAIDERNSNIMASALGFNLNPVEEENLEMSLHSKFPLLTKKRIALKSKSSKKIKRTSPIKKTLTKKNKIK